MEPGQVGSSLLGRGRAGHPRNLVRPGGDRDLVLLPA